MLFRVSLAALALGTALAVAPNTAALEDVPMPQNPKQVNESTDLLDIDSCPQNFGITERNQWHAFGAGGDFYHIDTCILELLDIDSCPQNFGITERNQWHAFGADEFYHVDAFGRPDAAYILLPPVISAGLRRTCQSSIGRWGRAEDPTQDYDGGHMIPALIGGWGGRANLVPQERNFNRGVYRDLTTVIAACALTLEPSRLEVRVDVEYANAATLIPDYFAVTLEDRNCWFWNCDDTVYFSNQPGGGANGYGELEEAKQWLVSIGCNFDYCTPSGNGLLQC